MRKMFVSSVAVAALCASAAFASLEVGTKVEGFTAQASLDGKEFEFSLDKALKRGPVVLYFYPAAFTKGCTVEAHDFAEATQKFKDLHATVVGVSHDTIDTLDKFSVSECRSKFAVVADPEQKVIKAFDAVLKQKPEYADRTSYVIAPNHRVIFVYTDLNPDKHVELTMAAVRKWRLENP